MATLTHVVVNISVAYKQVEVLCFAPSFGSEIINPAPGAYSRDPTSAPLVPGGFHPHSQ